MPFDPTLPANSSPNSSAEMRGQLVSLFDLIQAIPAGPPGPPGPPIGNVGAGPVTTLNPGEPANVQVTFDGTTATFFFGIPRGFEGAQGISGINGTDGGPGAQGPPFASAVVDAVNTLNPGENATVQSSFDGTTVHFTFGIPRGNDGGSGTQGPPGEVTLAQLNAAIATTSNNSNAVATLDTPFVNDPPTLADIELLRTKLNDLILALRR